MAHRGHFCAYFTAGLSSKGPRYYQGQIWHEPVKRILCVLTPSSEWCYEAGFPKCSVSPRAADMSAQEEQPNLCNLLMTLTFEDFQ